MQTPVFAGKPTYLQATPLTSEMETPAGPSSTGSTPKAAASDYELDKEEQYSVCYLVRPMAFADRPDTLRSELEDAIHAASFPFRDHPTLPANPSKPMACLPGARADDCGLFLPQKHCAFRGCAWCGSDSLAFITHLQLQHCQDSEKAMEACPSTMKVLRLLFVGVHR